MKIKTIQEAIEFLQEKVNISVDNLQEFKWKIYDEDINFCVKQIKN